MKLHRLRNRGGGAGGYAVNILSGGAGVSLSPPKNPISLKYKISLGKGALPPCPPPKSYICTNFGRKGTEIVHLWFPQIHILLWKEDRLPLATTRKFRPQMA